MKVAGDRPQISQIQYMTKKTRSASRAVFIFLCS
jgi:hypothetical protein